MNIVIIEDEKLMAEDLAETIIKVEPAAKIIASLRSVNEAKVFFGRKEKADLIFSDVQLGDGLSFEIFQAIPASAPVIFCTAYDEYALNAFKANGIDYILKPFTDKAISDALVKYKDLKQTLSQTGSYASLQSSFEINKDQQCKSILVHFKDRILPVRLDEIALFYIKNEITHLVTFNQKTYSIGKTLEELEKLAGYSFYRANRRFLVNRKAIRDAAQHFHRKLIVNLSVPFTTDEPITVSKAKVPEFLNWLSAF